MVRAGLCGQGGRVDTLRAGARPEPRGGGGCLAGNVPGDDAKTVAAGAAGALLRPELSQPRAELSAQPLAAADTGTGIAPLVRGFIGGIAAGTGCHALPGHAAAGSARGHRVENLARLHIRGSRGDAGNFTQHRRGAVSVWFAKVKSL